MLYGESMERDISLITKVNSWWTKLPQEAGRREIKDTLNVSQKKELHFLRHFGKRSHLKLLGWPKSMLGFFLTILQKNSNALFHQPNIIFAFHCFKNYLRYLLNMHICKPNPKSTKSAVPSFINIPDAWRTLSLALVKYRHCVLSLLQN